MTTIKRMDEIKPNEPLAAGLTSLYRTAFAEIDTLAAQRHDLTRPELEHIWSDHRVQKWIAFEGTMPVGVAVITKHLSAWPLISPRHFQRIEPERYAAGKIWYVGFVGVLPGHNLFSDLITSMAPQVVQGHGMAVMDFAHYNVAVRHIDRATGILLNHFARTSTDGRVVARGQEIDAQHFYAWSFGDAVQP